MNPKTQAAIAHVCAIKRRDKYIKLQDVLLALEMHNVKTDTLTQVLQTLADHTPQPITKPENRK